MSPDPLFLLPVAAVSAIFVIALIFWIGGKMSPNVPKNDPEKLAPYACGEEFQIEEHGINMERFLIYALYFLIFDVLTFIMAVSFFERGIMPAIYSAVALASVAVLVMARRHK
ncbi:MAG: NADH-quinone oxidoreductase subunit A [Candidatus Methanomethyliales bacterium]|nr:NADH-quinone oxidoreductase subunit A [Candidatus Methanomethylicales archaeon]